MGLLSSLLMAGTGGQESHPLLDAHGSVGHLVQMVHKEAHLRAGRTGYSGSFEFQVG